MGTCFLYGNGGDGFNLNLSFKNYASSSALLADTPKENTIGIVSTVAVSIWRFTSVTKPGATRPAGSVYINAILDGDNRSSTTIPTFDPINKNNNMILLKPTGCLQLVNGSWEKMTAYIYKKNTWLQFSESVPDQYVVFNGKNTADYVGGWSGDVSSGVLSVIKGGSQGWIPGENLCSNVAIDISKYSTMHIVVNEYKDKGTFGIGTTNASGKYDKSVAITSAKEYTINVSDLNGKYYVKLASTGKQNNTNYYESIGFSVSKVWLE